MNESQIIISEGDEKTIFERAIIEAFKQKSGKIIVEKLSIALDEIKFVVKETQDYNMITSNQKKKYILNINILDKLRRLVERQIFSVKIVVGKIYEKLLDTENFLLLSMDVDLLIKLSNEILDLLEDLKSTSTAFILERKCLNFLNYLKTTLTINDEQLQVIDEVLKSLPSRYSSEAYNKFDATKDKIIGYCKASEQSSKLEGLNLLMESFSQMSSLDEQFEILIEKVPAIIKVVIYQPNPELKDVYFQIGHFLCSMLYNFSFVLDSNISEFYKLKKDLKENSLFIIKDEQLLTQVDSSRISFLNEFKYELTSQKDSLLKCESLVKVCLQVINTLCVYEKIFDLQYVCFILLKRVYFTFPKFRSSVEDLISLVLVNICSFTGKYEVDNSQECRLFVYYILTFDESSIKTKLSKRLEAKAANSELLVPRSNSQISDVEFETLKLRDFNLRIGYPIIMDVEAGKEEFKYIEVKEAYSLVYIGFATHSYDINFKIYKYSEKESDSSELNKSSGYFKEIISVERIEANDSPVKVLILAQEPCFYKIVWDNSFSWINGKKLRIRTSVLRPLPNTDMEKLILLSKEADIVKIDISQDEKFKDNKVVELDNITTNSNLDESSNQKLIFRNNEQQTGKFFSFKSRETKKSYNVNNFIDYGTNSISSSKMVINLFVLVAGPKYKILTVNPDKDLLECNEKLLLFGEFENNSESFDQNVYNAFETEVNKFGVILENTTLKAYLNLCIFSSSEKAVLADEENTKNKSEKDLEKILGYNNEEFNKKIKNKNVNLTYKMIGVAEALLLHTFYKEFLHNGIEIEKNKPRLHINFNLGCNPQSAFFQGNQIFDKLNGLKFDISKSISENIEAICNFISKTQMLFEECNIEFSFFNPEESKQIEKSDSSENSNDTEIYNPLNSNFIDEVRAKLEIKEPFEIKKISQDDWYKALSIMPNFSN